MNGAAQWSRILVIVGLIAMGIGALDPLEGAFVILPGTGLVALGARLGHSRHRRLLDGSFALVAVGFGALLWLSSLGGFGGSSGRSNWWGLFLLPYPVGWILGIVGAIRRLREGSGAAVPPAAH